MKSEKIINHGTLIDSINYSALINAQARGESFVDNKSVERGIKTKPEGVKTLSKVRTNPRPRQKNTKSGE